MWKEDGVYKYTKEESEKRKAYAKEHLSAIKFLMKKEEYAEYKAAADKAGMKFSTWVRKACNEELKENHPDLYDEIKDTTLS